MRKKFFVPIFMMLFMMNFLLGGVIAYAATYYEEDNDGNTEETAYIIDSIEDLKLLRDRVNGYKVSTGTEYEDSNKYYKLTVDIDLTTETDWQPIGYDGSNSTNFGGHFDGNNKTIIVNIDRKRYAGLFGYIGRYWKPLGENVITCVKNLNVVGKVKATESSTSPAAWVGGIAISLNTGLIENCTFSGDVKAECDSLPVVGGITAQLRYGKISNCKVLPNSYVYGGVESNMTQSGIGGIVGFWENTEHAGSILNCISEATISADSDVARGGHYSGMGGILGRSGYDASQLNVSSSSEPLIYGNKYSGADYGIGDDRMHTYRGDKGCENIGKKEEENNNNAEENKNDEQSTDNTITPENNNISVNSRSYIHGFTMTDALRNSILAAFPGLSASEIFQFTDSEIISDTWSIQSHDTSAITNLGESVAINLPVVSPLNAGVYVMRFSLDNAKVGQPLQAHSVYGNAYNSSVNASDVGSLEYKFFDENYNEITTVPSSKVVYAAVRMTAGQTGRGVLTTSGLYTGTITPVSEDLRVDLTSKIRETLSIGPDVEIRFIEAVNIGEPVDPSTLVQDKAKVDNTNLIGKLNALSVDVDAVYVWKVTLSPELEKEFVSHDVSNFKIYSSDITATEFVPATVMVKSAIFAGLMNTFELLTMSGEKMQFGAKEFLMVGFLNAGKPLSLYIARMILAILLGGCNAGFDLVAFVSIGALITFIVKKKNKS